MMQAPIHPPIHHNTHIKHPPTQTCVHTYAPIMAQSNLSMPLYLSSAETMFPNSGQRNGPGAYGRRPSSCAWFDPMLIETTVCVCG